MYISLDSKTQFSLDFNSVILFKTENDLSNFSFKEQELTYIKNQIERKQKTILINRFSNLIYIVQVDSEGENYKIDEKIRQSAPKIVNSFKEQKIDTFYIYTPNDHSNLLKFAEGAKLADYQFIKYFKEKEEKTSSINNLVILSDKINNNEVDNLNNLLDYVLFARDIINEPVNFLNTEKFAQIIEEEALKNNIQCTIWDKAKLTIEKMNGILAVNKGSIDPPFFAQLEWKPDNSINEKPIILVGKGVTFDTGGLSLKPTGDSMDYMKVDMGGAAVSLATILAVAKNNLPIHIITLIPSTDNRPDGNAYAPGDIITMRNGMTVEVLNTDAEGRMILADALHVAQELNPEVVLSVATLTGAASAAIGPLGIVTMGNAGDEWMNKLKISGNNVFERTVEFPFWDEYSESLKSDIADLKNIGGKYAGMITAGKFLENFTNYPYIHLDIAGVTHLKAADSYRSKGASGMGVRLLYNFIENYK